MKKLTKILCCVLGLGFLLGGCATVSNISNSNPELIYNGNSAVMVDGYLYYGNAFSDTSAFSSNSDYSNAARVGYLARLNTNIDLMAKDKDYSPRNVENVASEVVGYENNFMFVLGNYIYYATPYTGISENADGESGHYYNYTTIYRSRLNGDNKTRLYTTNGEISQIEVLKFGENYYIVLLAGGRLVKIQISGRTSSTVLAENVESAAIPKTYQQNVIGSSLDWNGNIYFTTTRSDEDNSDLNGSELKKVSITDNTESTVYHQQDVTITFLGRDKDVVFFSRANEVYMTDFGKDDLANAVSDPQKRVYAGSTISNLMALGTENGTVGYTFNDSNSNLLYVSSDGKRTGAITLQNDGSPLSGYNILFTTGRTIYISTTTGIYSADLSPAFNGNGGPVSVNCTTVVTMTAIYDGSLYAYDGRYIYFYAQLEEVELEDEDETPETDSNYYLYRTRAVKSSSSDADPYQLLGRTQITSRQSND